MTRFARLACFGTLTVAFVVAPARAEVWEVSNRLLTSGAPTTGAEFGRTFAVGDFDNDGVDDLAIAEPRAAILSFSQVGSVRVLLGRTGRLLELRSVVSPIGPADDLFIGTALAAGNFDDSPQDELVLGATGTFDAGATAGSIAVAYFDVPGTSVAFQHVRQTDIPFPAGGSAGEGDLFGAALTVGDFDSDGYDDLAIGAPGVDNAGTAAMAGKFYVLYGSGPGLAVDASSQGVFAIGPQAGGRYGAALASGDFDGDGFDDLAVGEPGRTISGQLAAGRFEVLFGAASGISTSGTQLFDNGTFGLTPESGDGFGQVLAAADFDGPGAAACASGPTPCADDLAIGSPLEDVGAVNAAGIVVVAFGEEGTGLVAAGAQVFDQSALGFDVEIGDEFGAALFAGNLDGEHGDEGPFAARDLIVGVPFEDVVGGEIDQGVLHLLHGVVGVGLDLSNSELEQQFAGYLSAPAHEFDRFGTAAAAGDFDGDGVTDLAVGLARREVQGVIDAGAAQLLFGALFADGFERGSPTAWSSTAP